MDIIPGNVIIDTAPRAPQPQPVDALANLDPQLDDKTVRQAIANAEANNMDPQTLTMEDFSKLQTNDIAAAPQPTRVPEKFIKPDGAVDVEKIVASTKQLDVAIQKKEEAVNKTVDDYLREYQERENKYRNLPNPEKLAANLPQVSLPPAAPLPQQNLNPQQFEEIVRRDYNADPLATTTRLIELAVENRFAPMKEREKLDSVRTNIQSLAEKDARVLNPQVFEAIKNKLNSNPELWSLPNPHRIAWLEVKEEMRLGESATTPAQPSRPLSPVLGGGTPPSAPSASGQYSPQDVISNLHKLDLRDKKQEALGDAAIRAALLGTRG